MQKTLSAALFVILLLAIGANRSFASNPLTMTGGRIEATRSFDNPMTFSGYDSGGQSFVLTAKSGFGLAPPFGPIAPNSLLSTDFFSGGGDVISPLLSIGGTDTPINVAGGAFGRPDSFIDIHGPSVLLPSSPVSQTVNLSISFSVRFNLYSDFTVGSEPDCAFMGTGFGNLEIVLQASPPEAGAAPSSRIISATYTLNSVNSGVPEPTSLAISSVLALVGIGWQRRWQGEARFASRL